MVDSWAYDFKAVVHVRQGEQRLAMQVGLGNVEGVEGWRVVVEDAEEVVVVTKEIGGGGERRSALRDMSSGLQGAKIGY